MFFLTVMTVGQMGSSLLLSFVVFTVACVRMVGLPYLCVVDDTSKQAVTTALCGQALHSVRAY